MVKVPPNVIAFPPILLTRGDSAVPPKSPVNCIIPFALDVASVADIVPEAIVIPEPGVKAPCLALNAAKSELVNNPVTVLVALGILVAIAFVILPLLSTVIVGTLVDV